MVYVDPRSSNKHINKEIIAADSPSPASTAAQYACAARIGSGSVPRLAIGWVRGGTSRGRSISVRVSKGTNAERHTRRTTPGDGAACSETGGGTVEALALIHRLESCRTLAPDLVVELGQHFREDLALLNWTLAILDSRGQLAPLDLQLAQLHCLPAFDLAPVTIQPGADRVLA